MIGSAFVFGLVLFGLSECNSAKFPGQLQRCHRSDPGMDTCLAKAIEGAIQLASLKGMPSLGLPRIDPIDISEIHIGEGASAVNLVQNYYSVQLHGLRNSKVVKAHLDSEKLELTFTLTTDLIQRAKYNLTGKVLFLPVYGDGDSALKFDGCTIPMKIGFKEQIKDGIKFYKVDKYVIDVNVIGANYDFQNLFNGQKELADNILKVINDNSMEIFQDVKPGVDKSYALVFKALAKTVFDKIPADEIFPE